MAGSEEHSDRSQEKKDQEGPGAYFYLKYNLKRGQILIFIHPMSKCKETAVYFSHLFPSCFPFNDNVDSKATFDIHRRDVKGSSFLSSGITNGDWVTFTQRNMPH